jgi:hypothetical protein
MKQPSAIINLANRTLSAAESGLVSLQVTLTRGNHDAVRLIFWPKSKFSGTQPGDTLSIQLGFKSDEQDVWSGKVARVEQTQHGLVVTGHAPTAGLARQRKSNTYVAQTAGDIVRDLASSIDIDSVDGSAEFAYYAVDERRTIWGHLVDLANLTGSEISCSAAGGLRFLDVNPLPSTARFRFGADLLRWQLGPGVQLSAPTFAAHGSASESGSDKWHWLNPDPTSGAGGSQVIGGFHSRALADTLTQAIASRVARASVGGEVELVGEAGLRVGDVFSLTGLAADPGPLRATDITHRLDAAAGFRTVVRVEGIGA